MPCQLFPPAGIYGMAALTFELIDHKGNTSDEHMAHVRAYENGLAMYLARDWKAALTHLDEVLASHPDDLATQTLAARCREYMTNPPPEEWTGVITMMSK